jgi:hypothetical protein
VSLKTSSRDALPLQKASRGAAARYLSELGLCVDKAADMLPGDGLPQLLVAGQHNSEGEAGQPPQWEQGRQLQALHTNKQEFSPLCERGRAATTAGTEAPAAGPAHK